MSQPADPGLEALVELLARAICLRQAGQTEQALACLDQAIEANPHFLPALAKRAAVLAEISRYDEAIADLDTYLAFLPDSPEVSTLRNQILTDARAYNNARVSAAPRDTGAWYARGNLHMRTGDYTLALEDFRQAQTLSSSHPGVLNNLGNVLVALGRLDEALEIYNRLLALCPNDWRGEFNRANVLQQLNRLDAASFGYARVIALQPDFAEAQLELAHCKLHQGQFAEGWQLYERRWQTERLKHRKLYGGTPPWLGQASLTGKRIVLWAEQGLGDTLQFARFVRQVADQAGHVALCVPACLHSLMTALDGRIELTSSVAELPAHDYHCPLMSLPLALAINPLTMAAPPAYLRAATPLVAAWQTRLGPARRPRIGLVWAGRQDRQRNPSRDIPFTALRPLTALPADFVSLHDQLPAADVSAALALNNFYHFGDALTDMAATAALIECLDLVIAADTAVAHLAGALGKPCWLLLRHSGEWRWLAGRSDSPWYPSLRLFRQSQRGDWSGLAAHVAQTLKTQYLDGQPSAQQATG